MTVMYDIMCVIWQMIASIFGVLLLYGLIKQLIKEFGGEQHDDE